MKVKDLKEFLKLVDDEFEVESCGPDIGGYDAEDGPMNVLHVDLPRQILFLCHTAENIEECIDTYHLNKEIRNENPVHSS